MSSEAFYSIIIQICAIYFGGVVTYYASLKVFERQQNSKKVNIAKAFLSEIKSLEKWLQPSVNDEFLVEGKEELRVNLYRHALDTLHWDRPFYDDDGLFFISRAEMYCLDEGSFEKLELFYSNILVSDEYRQIFVKDTSFGPVIATYHERRRYKETIEALKHDFSLIEEIKDKLQNVISTYGQKK